MDRPPIEELEKRGVMCSGQDLLAYIRHLEAVIREWDKANIAYSKAPTGFIAVIEMDKVEKMVQGVLNAQRQLRAVAGNIPTKEEGACSLSR